MKVSILRATTEQCAQEILIGEFNDIYHPAVFLKAMLNEALDERMSGRYIVEYDFSEEKPC